MSKPDEERVETERMKAGNGGGSIDYTARSSPGLDFPPMGRNRQMDARLCATGAARRGDPFSSLILQERGLCGIPADTPASGQRTLSKGTTLLFLRPTFRPRRPSQRILPSVTPRCSLDRRATPTVADFLPTRVSAISPLEFTVSIIHRIAH